MHNASLFLQKVVILATKHENPGEKKFQNSGKKDKKIPNSVIVILVRNCNH